MKKSTIIIILLFIVILIFGYAYFFCSQPKNELIDYYKNLAKECESTQGYNCCISSVNYMSKGNFKLIPGTNCSAGYKPNTLECIDSFTWCEPIK